MLKAKPKKSPGQTSLPWDVYQVSERTLVHEVAEKFIRANCFNPRLDQKVAVPGIGSRKR
jgi:putative transposase